MLATRGETGKLIFKEGDEDVQEQSMSAYLKGTSFLGLKLALLVGIVFLMVSVTQQSSNTTLRAASVQLSAEETTELREEYGAIADVLGSAATFAIYSGSTTTGPVIQAASTLATLTGPTISGYVGSGATSLTTSSYLRGTIYFGATQTTVAAAAKFISTAYTTILAKTATVTSTSTMETGLTFTPGVYVYTGTSVTFKGTTTLDCQGASSCEFYFRGKNVGFSTNAVVQYANVATGVTPVTIWVSQGMVQFSGGTTVVGTVLATGNIVSYAVSSGPLLSVSGYVTVASTGGKVTVGV